MMSEKRFIVVDHSTCVFDKITKEEYVCIDREEAFLVCKRLNEQDKEIGLLRLELDAHKNPLWSTREAEKKVNELSDSLADEIKKNGLLNEELIKGLEQLRKGLDSFKQNLEVVVEQCNETLKRLKEEYDE